MLPFGRRLFLAWNVRRKASKGRTFGVQTFPAGPRAVYLHRAPARRLADPGLRGCTTFTTHPTQETNIGTETGPRRQHLYGSILGSLGVTCAAPQDSSRGLQMGLQMPAKDAAPDAYDCKQGIPANWSPDQQASGREITSTTSAQKGWPRCHIDMHYCSLH